MDAGMTESVDVVDLKSTGVKSVPVRVRLPVPRFVGTAHCAVRKGLIFGEKIAGWSSGSSLGS